MRLSGDFAIRSSIPGLAAMFCGLWVTAIFAGSPVRAQAAPAYTHTLPSRVSFLNDVEPILTRAGCNLGSCHGSQLGKGGFKLSLAAFDPPSDYDSIVRAGKGRRISTQAPPTSLLLRKPALEIGHLGGLKIARDSADYRTLARWLEQGAPGPNLRDPHVTAVVVTPARVKLRIAGQAQITIRAHFSDGSSRDVTAHTRINSLDETVASASAGGRIVARGAGETAVMIRYDGLAAVSRVAVPYTWKYALAARRGAAIVRAATNSAVDRATLNRWRDLGIEPSGPCTDPEFLRRASLDIIGTLPSPDEVRAFASDKARDKDARLIDRLLERPEYADLWTLKWCDLLRVNRSVLGEKGMWSYRNWIHDSLIHNRPYDAFVHELITAQGGAFTEPAANYYRTATIPQDQAEATAQLFLGVRMQCAKCHHHPFEKWSQADYYQFSAFFARVGYKSTLEPGASASEPVVRVLAAGEVVHPKTGLRMTPTPLALQDGPTLSLDATDADLSGDRRRPLADWLTSPNNRTFAKMLVNRYWGIFLGRGIVQPVDDMRITNPPSNPELLDALADDFTTHGYDLKRLIRVICTSRAYRISARPTARNRADEMFYSHFKPRRQPAETLLDSVNAAAGTHEKFPGLPPETRAIQLPDTTVDSAFLDTFGRPQRTTSCECERVIEPSLSQELQFLNGELVNRKVVDPAGRIASMIAAARSDAEIVDELYFAALSRPPRSGERALAMRALACAPARRQAAEDLLWALINTREFAEVR